MFKTRQKLVKKKTSDDAFEILSCFEHTKKKLAFMNEISCCFYHLSVNVTFSRYYGDLFVDA